MGWVDENPCKTFWIVIFIIAGLGCTVAIIIIGTVLGGQTEKQSESQAFVVAKGRAGAVAADDKRCSEAGLQVLENGGNAVDAAVASLLCLGVVNFQSSGIGGGLMMLVAKKNTSSPTGYTVTVIDARERAPIYARESDYLPVNASGKNIHTETGTLSIAIPGELRGMEMALGLFSINTSAKRTMIFEKAIEYAERGFSPSQHLLNAIKDNSGIARFNKNPTFNYENLRNLVMTSDGESLDEGKTITRKSYANTLKKIRDNGFHEFYTGATAVSLLNDINDAACKELPSKYCSSTRITMGDLRSYRAKRRDPLQFDITGSAKVMYTAPAPASGSALALFLKIMQVRVPERYYHDDAVTYHYLLEASKFSNSHLMNLGDPEFNQRAKVTVDDVNSELREILRKENPQYAHNDDLKYYDFMAGPSESNFGTTHVVVATSNGDVVSVTSTINDYFGSGLLSSSTGVILNDQMDDFYVPKSGEDRFRYNHVQGGKRPLSSATPAIMTDSNGNLRLALGASGGRRIPPAVGQSAFFIVNRGESIDNGIKRPRVYATLDDMGGTRIVEYVEKSGEYSLSREIQGELMATYRHYGLMDYRISVVQAIELQGSTFGAYSDPRKRGEAAAYG